ncbi:MAG: hypothetical protein ACPL88_07810, partial [Bryobacteraceae bacterium]
MTANASSRYLPYRLTLQSPLIVTTRHGDPNSAATQLFISGSSIRGVVASRLLSAGVDADSDGFRRLVLSGEVRYLNAYVEIQEERSLPVPLSWRVFKSDHTRGRDLACYAGAPPSASESDESAEHRLAEQLEPLGDDYFCPRLISGRWVAAQPRAGARIHHQRDREKGRAWKDQDGRAHG